MYLSPAVKARNWIVNTTKTMVSQRCDIERPGFITMGRAHNHIMSIFKAMVYNECLHQCVGHEY